MDRQSLIQSVRSKVPSYGPLLQIFQKGRGLISFTLVLVYLLRLFGSRTLEISKLGLVASITIPHTIDSYHIILHWASQRFSKLSWLRAAPLQYSQLEGPETTASERSYARKCRMRFEIGFVPILFRHRGRFFVLQRLSQESDNAFARDKAEEITLWTLGSNPRPIQDLISDIVSERKEKPLSNVWMVRGKNERSFAPWIYIRKTPDRSMDTVFLNQELKKKVIADVADYLGNEMWYVDRGVPWRRGYLFYGPPGTGKTSFALALANQFGLDIYLLVLGNRTLDDQDLIAMFTKLPRRSLILLEDVDGAEMAKSRKTSGKRDTSEDEKARVTLPGLLNAFDGISGAEGRVLVLSTNYRDRLDDALLRAGRIDFEVEFTLPNKHTIQQMFMKFFAERDEDVDSVAHKFADSFPDDTFSQAEIQEFLILMKGRKLAEVVGEVKTWVDKKQGEKQKRQQEGK